MIDTACRAVQDVQEWTFDSWQKNLSRVQSYVQLKCKKLVFFVSFERVADLSGFLALIHTIFSFFQKQAFSSRTEWDPGQILADAWHTRALYLFIHQDDSVHESFWEAVPAECVSSVEVSHSLILSKFFGILFTRFVWFVCRSRREGGAHFKGWWDPHFIPAERRPFDRLCGISAG